MSTLATLYESIAKMPAINQHVVVNRFGGPEVLEIVEDEIPQPGPGTVRVRIMAAGLSGADLLMREGVHPRTPRIPFTPGWDLVGFVDELGPGVTGLEHGAHGRGHAHLGQSCQIHLPQTGRTHARAAWPASA